MPKYTLVAVLMVGLLGIGAVAKDRAWQTGTWRDSQVQTENLGAYSLPIGGTPPTTTVAGVTFSGTAPAYFAVPLTGTVQLVTIEGSDHMLYVGSRSIGRPSPIIVNDAVTFALDREKLYVKLDGKELAFSLVKRVRQTP